MEDGKDTASPVDKEDSLPEKVEDSLKVEEKKEEVGTSHSEDASRSAGGSREEVEEGVLDEGEYDEDEDEEEFEDEDEGEEGEYLDEAYDGEEDDETDNVDDEVAQLTVGNEEAAEEQGEGTGEEKTNVFRKKEIRPLPSSKPDYSKTWRDKTEFNEQKQCFEKRKMMTFSSREFHNTQRRLGPQAAQTTDDDDKDDEMTHFRTFGLDIKAPGYSAARFRRPMQMNVQRRQYVEEEDYGEEEDTENRRERELHGNERWGHHPGESYRRQYRPHAPPEHRRIQFMPLKKLKRTNKPQIPEDIVFVMRSKDTSTVGIERVCNKDKHCEEHSKTRYTPEEIEREKVLVRDVHRLIADKGPSTVDDLWVAYLRLSKKVHILHCREEFSEFIKNRAHIFRISFGLVYNLPFTVPLVIMRYVHALEHGCSKRNVEDGWKPTLFSFAYRFLLNSKEVNHDDFLKMFPSIFWRDEEFYPSPWVVTNIASVEMPSVWLPECLPIPADDEKLEDNSQTISVHAEIVSSYSFGLKLLCRVELRHSCDFFIFVPHTILKKSHTFYPVGSSVLVDAVRMYVQEHSFVARRISDTLSGNAELSSWTSKGKTRLDKNAMTAVRTHYIGHIPRRELTIDELRNEWSIAEQKKLKAIRDAFIKKEIEDGLEPNDGENAVINDTTLFLLVQDHFADAAEFANFMVDRKFYFTFENMPGGREQGARLIPKEKSAGLQALIRVISEGPLTEQRYYSMLDDLQTLSDKIEGRLSVEEINSLLRHGLRHAVRMVRTGRVVTSEDGKVVRDRVLLTNWRWRHGMLLKDFGV